MKRNNHYISRCYQRNFADPVGTENIYCFRRSYQRWVSKSSKGIGWLRDLYTTIDEEDVETDEFESFLQFVENHVAPVLRKQGENPQPLSSDERYAIAYFTALLISRSPRCIDFAGDVAGRIAMDAFNSATPHIRCKMEEQLGFDLPVRIDPDKYSVEVSRNTILVGSLQFAQIVAPQLCDLTWMFLMTDNSHPFITTDWPALVRSEGDKVIYDASLPLSSTVAILMRHVGKEGAGNARPKDVEYMNRRALCRAAEFVVCRQTSFPGDSELKSWASDSSSVHAGM